MLTIVTLVKDNAAELFSQREILCALNNSKVTWYIKDSSKNHKDIDILSNLKANWQGSTRLVIDSSEDLLNYQDLLYGSSSKISTM